MARWMRLILFAVLVLGLADRPLRAQAAAGEAPLKIGVFDPETLWKVTEVGKKYNSDLTQARDQLQGDIDKKSQALEDLKDSLRKQQTSLSDEKVQQMQKDILAKRTELERINEDATKEMKFKLGDLQGRFNQMMVQAVEAYGKEKRLAVILSKDATVYTAADVDITQDLVARFNAMHKASASTPPTRKGTEKPKAPGGRRKS